MKTIGMIGGMSWESSILYYQWINEAVKERLGGHHSAKSLMFSVDFEQIKAFQYAGKWEEATNILVDAAKKLELGGADCVVICTNTMHKVAEKVQESTKLPLLHIADATGKQIVQQGIKKVGLLATAFTMEEEFYKGRLKEYGLDILVPEKSDREKVHDIIYNELCLGKIEDSSRLAYIDIINNLISEGAEGIILGCTEITLLISQKDCKVPVFDTTRIHATAAVDFALSEK
ncbi:hypothetical protein AN964_02630 [Heyndrickxia shackletonii]|uniref:Aspartate racemase n=1 Tax=Heyndrickxia shackletonii TaxID=157838 RepID=A0A0Q3WVH1_9BACI|nr:aspartate/glutamate racemase family protein [Heyndrickxia shackletonii]KQL52538.1 hypothetical protein AN964_02630 [Heyndrickxia shackletonii]MBB2480586.1 aspartate/glutamate racemase family protein [Bacillus sp. APMAM]NEZ01160.1 aspartate/glutamate racemase family protein [Heyndrickxia shackletonii]RTZ56814.1 aspartate/glutamate racemase family protein [Bacillus sp. SAJ1]